MHQQPAWRIGFFPQPWEWTDWRWAGADGRFNGRWDPLDHGLYRTVYAGESLLGCYVELLAQYRPDQYLYAEMEEIEEDEKDAENFPSIQTGTLDIQDWLTNRMASKALLTGEFIDVTALKTVQWLRPRFNARALAYGLKDFDVSVLKNADQRLLTQEVSQYLWMGKNPDGTDLCDGIQFRSRHGDDLVLWAIFERENDGQISSHIDDIKPYELQPDDKNLLEAIKILGIRAV